MAIIPRTIKGIRQHINNPLFIQSAKKPRGACISCNNVNAHLAMFKTAPEILAIVIQDTRAILGERTCRKLFKGVNA